MKNSKELETKKSSINVKRTKNIAYTLLIITFLYVPITIAWIITENTSILPFMEIITVWSAIVIIQFMVEIYRGSSANKKSHSLIALILSGCMATGTIINHFIYLTVLSQIFSVKEMPSWLLLYGWPSVTKGLECVSWGFFLGMAMLFASSALEDLGNKVITWTMRISGIMCLTGLVGPIIGNMNYYMISTVGYSVGFLVFSIEIILYFNKKNRQLTGNEQKIRENDQKMAFCKNLENPDNEVEE